MSAGVVNAGGDQPLQAESSHVAESVIGGPGGCFDLDVIRAKCKFIVPLGPLLLQAERNTVALAALTYVNAKAGGGRQSSQAETTMFYPTSLLRNAGASGPEWRGLSARFGARHDGDSHNGRERPHGRSDSGVADMAGGAR
jgi:hypothetical protein